jgi:hypothetical protein
MFKLKKESLLKIFLSSFLSLFAPPKLNVNISKYDIRDKLQCIKININLSPILLYAVLGNDSLRSNFDIELFPEAVGLFQFDQISP